MTPEYTNQLATQLLLSGMLTVLALGLIVTLLALLAVRRNRTMASRRPSPGPAPAPRYQPSVFEHHCRWIAVKSSQTATVQTALGLHNPVPCSWGEGMSRLASRKLFVSPPIHGWILVVGQGLPDPSEDIDRCFHFIVRLSRAVGQVQFFSANRAVNHHAWVRAEGGQIRRAYAWGGETLWNQGRRTQAELDLGMRCFDYGEAPQLLEIPQGDNLIPNAEKIMALAARWSLDPSNVSESTLRAGLGVVGDLTDLRPH